MLIQLFISDVPFKDRDWHTGSNEQVLDLVHPSIYPLVFGQTRALCKETVTVEDCMSRYGQGRIVILPDHERHHWIALDKRWSRKYQWLPTDFKVSKETGDAK